MKYTLLICLSLLAIAAMGQSRRHEYRCTFAGFAATHDQLPFWATTNCRNIVPNQTGTLLFAEYHSRSLSTRAITLHFGISLTAHLPGNTPHLFLDQCYISPTWKKLHLDLGMTAPETRFAGIATSNGNIVYSGNSRNLPGYNLHSDLIPVPGCRSKLHFKFNFADYLMTDNRHVKNTRLHNQSLLATIHIHPHLTISLGIEDWAQWAGTSPENGKQPSNFTDYLRIITGRGGDEDATRSDQINTLGNHVGREVIILTYEASLFTLTFQHDIPYEDGSGMGLQNFPDGINTLHWASRCKRQAVTDLLYEFHYTKCQSGRFHDRPTTPEEIAEQSPSDPFYGRKVIGGNDNYFNNGEYRSGWTYHGRTIGCPLFIPALTNDKGITPGIASNRYTAHHLGIKGFLLRKIPYTLKATYSHNLGKYNQTDSRFNTAPHQLSIAIEGEFPSSRHLPLGIGWGLYIDSGQVYPDNAGFSLRLTFHNCFTTGKHPTSL